MGLFGKSRTDSLNEIAQEFINEGNELKNEYNQLIKQAKQRVDELNQAIEEDTKYKEQIIHEIGDTLQESLKEFQLEAYNPKESTIEYHLDTKGNSLLKNIINYQRELNLWIYEDPGRPHLPNEISIFMQLLDSDEAEKQAYRTSLDARRYMVQMNNAVEKVKNNIIGIDAMLRLVHEEQETVCRLMGKIHCLSNYLKKLSDQKEITDDKVKYAESLYVIAKKIRDSVKWMIIDSQGHLSEDYKYYLNNLKKTDAGLPETPSLTNIHTKTWADLVLTLWDR